MRMVWPCDVKDGEAVGGSEGGVGRGEKNLIVSGVDKDLVGNRRHRRLQHADPTLPLTDKG